MDFSKHTEGTTSVKVHHAPGGKSNFSLGWDAPEPAPKKPTTQPVAQQVPIQQAPVQQQKLQQPIKPQNNQTEPAGKTSVKVHNPPGGKSSFTFG